jgi:hypothetical protein
MPNLHYESHHKICNLRYELWFYNEFLLQINTMNLPYVHLQFYFVCTIFLSDQTSMKTCKMILIVVFTFYLISESDIDTRPFSPKSLIVFSKS